MRKTPFVYVFFVLLFSSALSSHATTAPAQESKESNLSNNARHQELHEFALTHDGDVEHGQTLFAKDQRLNCSKCHNVEGTSRSVGPNLSAVGYKFQRTDLITSVLEPSKTIAVGFGMTTVAMNDGRVVSGVLQRVTNDEMELLDKENKSIRVAIGDIDEQAESTVSLMPTGLEQQLTNQEFVDLIAYLESLKSTPNLSPSSGVTNEIARASVDVSLQNAFEGLRFDHPVWFGQIPNRNSDSVDNASYLVLEQAGRAFVVQHQGNQWTRSVLFDNSASVRLGGATGLLGAAFHPKFASNNRYFVKYQTLDGQRIQTVVEERQFPIDAASQLVAEPRELLRIDAVTQDHNGGCIEFGPDGYLYIGMGDSGPQHDPQGHGQDLNTLLAKILRIDVDRRDSGREYGIPADNPFAKTANAKPEIWAYGFREPWRFSFDPVTDDLWVGDVGQDRIEEVAIVRRGENHGWNVYEGHTEHASNRRQLNAEYIAPVFSYPRSLGVSVTGGYVLRGPTATALDGWYICGDFESRRIWTLQQADRKLTRIVEIGRAPTRIVSFGVDATRQLYLVGYDDGIIYRMDFSAVDLTPRSIRMIADTSQQAGVLWRYTTQRPPENWTDPDFDDSQWNLGPGGFGTEGTPRAIVRTNWNTRDIWIRRSFTLDAPPADITALMLQMHHDEDTEVYLNGIEALRRGGWTSAYGEFGFSAESARTLKAGRNVIAAHCHQNSGGQYIDVGIIEYKREASITSPAAK